MGGKADPPGMGDTLAVEEDEIGRLPQFRKGRQERGPFPKGEKARDVGEGDTGRVGSLFEKGEAGKVHQDDRGEEEVAPLLVGDVGPGDGPDRIEGSVVP